MAFAGAAVGVALALTRTDQAGHRPSLHRLVVVAAAVTVPATVVGLWNDGGWATAAIGIAYLTLAATALGALVAGERSRRRGDVAS